MSIAVSTWMPDPAITILQWNSVSALWPRANVERTGRATAPYVARQGTVLGRSGEVHVSQDEDLLVWVGGGTITCIEGTVSL